MKLKRLVQNIAGVEVRGRKEVEITGVCSDSRRVAPGNLFVARKGKSFDGNLYVGDALAAGAAAIATDLYDPTLPVPQLISRTVATLEADLAAAFYENPSRELFTVGVTGTNGKTTVTTLVQHLLEPCGLLGTIRYETGRTQISASRSTPDVCSLQRMLREMVRSEQEAVAMEVTSHALDQGRVSHVEFDVAVYTNLSHDHLDYHGTMERYLAAKKLLLLQSKRLVVNGEDPHFASLPFQGPTIRYGIDQGDLRASNLQFSTSGTCFDVCYGGESASVELPLPGRFNVSNALAAIGSALFAGRSLSEIAARLGSAPQIPGRLERIRSSSGAEVFIDFAHTPDALKEALSALKELSPRRLIVVFGCGGERDVSKRPEMGRVAGLLADVVLITSDNPRREDPEAICLEIAEPLSDYQIIVDRRAAICEALAMGTEGDIILIAGKGHETSQAGPWGVRPFSDLQVVEESLR